MKAADAVHPVTVNVPSITAEGAPIERQLDEGTENSEHQ